MRVRKGGRWVPVAAREGRVSGGGDDGEKGGRRTLHELGVVAEIKGGAEEGQECDEHKGYGEFDAG